MKNHVTRHLLRTITLTFTLAPALAAVGCTPAQPRVPTPTTTAAFLESLAPEPIQVELDAKAGGAIQGNGTTFVIPPGAVFVPGGEPADIDTDGDGQDDSRRVDGVVTVELRELLSPEAMMEAGRPTVTSAGELLESGGAFDLTIRDGDQVVQVTNLLDLRITPERRPSSSDSMELWLADANADKFGWDRPVTGPVAAKQDADSFSIPNVPSGRINRPTTSKNIDTPRTRVANPVAAAGQVRVQLAAGAASDAAVFFFPEGMFSVVRMSRDATRGTAEAPTFVGPGAAMNGLRGTLVAVSVSGGKYFFEQRTLGLEALDGSDLTLVMSPAEVTADELRVRLGAR